MAIGLLTLLVALQFYPVLLTAQSSTAQIRASINDQEVELGKLRQQERQAEGQRHRLGLQEIRLIQQSQVADRPEMRSQLASVRADIDKAQQRAEAIRGEIRQIEKRLTALKNDLRRLETEKDQQQRDAARRAAEAARRKEAEAEQRRAAEARRAREVVEKSYLTVTVTPAQAQVKMMNIGPRYRDGMALAPGRYDIQVSALGYRTYRRWHTLESGQQKLRIALEPERTSPSRPAKSMLGDGYRDNGDGTVTNVKTGLQWMRCSLGQTWNDGTCSDMAETYTWQAALDAAHELNRQGGYADYRDWRVPTKDELNTLVYEKSAFPNMTRGWYWSSSTHPFSSDQAWDVYFYDSSVNAHNKMSSSHVRLVRGGR